MKTLNKFKSLIAGSLLSFGSIFAQELPYTPDLPKDVSIPQSPRLPIEQGNDILSKVRKFQSTLPSEQFLRDQLNNYFFSAQQLSNQLNFNQYKDTQFDQNKLVDILKTQQSKYFDLTATSFTLHPDAINFDGTATANFNSLKKFNQGDIHLTQGANSLDASLSLSGGNIDNASVTGKFKGIDFNATLNGFTTDKNTAFTSASFNYNGKDTFSATIDDFVAGKVTSIGKANFDLNGKSLGSVSNVVVDSSAQFKMTIGQINVGQRRIDNFYFNVDNSIIRFGGHYSDPNGILRNAQLDGIVGYDGTGIIGSLLISDPKDSRSIALLNYRVNTLYDALQLFEQTKHMSLSSWNLFSANGNLSAQLISNGKTINRFVKSDSQSTSFILNMMDHWDDGNRVYTISNSQASALSAAVKENKFTEAIVLLDGITPGTKYEFSRAVADFGSPFSMLAYQPLMSYPAFGVNIELYASQNDIIIDAKKGIFFAGLVLSNDQEYFGITRDRDFTSIFGIKYAPEFYQTLGSFTLNEGGGFVLAVNNGVTLGFDTQKSTKDFFNDAGFKDFPKLLNSRPVANASIHAGIGRNLDNGVLSFYGESVFTFRGDTSNKFPIHFNGLDLPITMIPITSIGTAFRANNMSLDGRIVFYDENNNNKPYVLVSGSALF